MGFDAASAEAYRKPIPNAVDVEFLIARNMVARALFVAPIIVLIAWRLSGSLGAVSAAIGVGVVTINFLLSGWVLSKAATISLQLYHAAALFGFFLRLGFITVSMFAVASLFEVDRQALGIAAVAAFMVLLILETVSMLRGAGKESEWS